MSALLGFTSEARWLRYARVHLNALFPRMPKQPGYNKPRPSVGGLYSPAIVMRPGGEQERRRPVTQIVHTQRASRSTRRCTPLRVLIGPKARPHPAGLFRLRIPLDLV